MNMNNLNEYTTEQLHQIINEAIALYDLGKPTGLSDSEYDVILEEYLNRTSESNRPYLRQTQTQSVNDIVGTLSKVYGVRIPMRDNQKTLIDWLKNKDLTNKKLLIQAKFDGCSVAYDMEANRFFTRGDYESGQSVDVTELFSNNIINYHENTLAMKYEAIMAVEDFEALRKQGYDYDTPRSMAQAFITRRDVDKVQQYVSLIPLRELNEYKDSKQLCVNESFAHSTHGRLIECDELDKIQSFIDEVLLKDGPFVYDASQDKSYMVDGCVVSIVSNENDKFVISDEVAIKIIKDIRNTKLINVEYSFGKNGRITPVAIFEPIQFGNITVTHATLSTFKRAQNLKVGDTISIMYNIVPYFVLSCHDGTTVIPTPTRCPYCGSELSTVSELIRCVNMSCPGIVLGGITRYCQNMNIFGLSEKTLRKLYDAKLVREISDLYRIKVSDIEFLDGFGEKKAKNIITSIHANSKNVPFAKFLGALPINDVSEKKWECVIRNPDIVDTLINGDIDDFIIALTRYPIQNIGTVTLKNIADGVRVNLNLIQYLLKSDKVTIQLPNLSRKNMNGTICLSGTRDKTLIEIFTNNGYEVTDNFTKNCLCVVIPDYQFESSKTKKARNLSIPVFTIEDAIDKFIRGK